MFNSTTTGLAEELIGKARSHDVTIATAESCTGGLLSAALTSVSGSSAVFERGFITYSNEAKNECLGVDWGLINTHGAVSAQVASAMVQGLATNSKATLFCSITGVAGPGGGSVEKPVGTVYIGIGKLVDDQVEDRIEDKVVILSHHNLFTGDRDAVRVQTLDTALKLLIARLEGDTF